MLIEKTKLEGLYVITLEYKEDERGYFARVFDDQKLPAPFKIVQINRSLTLRKGTIRGLHFQKVPREENKLVQCVKGSVFDVALDLRKKSKTYGQWFSQELTDSNKKMLLIPKGFAHGFQTLQNDCIIEYFVSRYYSPEYEGGIRWDDPAFGIKWPIENPFMSDKDSKWPDFNLNK